MPASYRNAAKYLSRRVTAIRRTTPCPINSHPDLVSYTEEEIFLCGVTMRRIVGERRMLRFCILMVVCRFDSTIGIPAEQPTRFTLNTGDPSTKNVAATFNYAPGQELLGRVTDAVRIGTGRFVNSVTLARNIIANQAQALASETENNVAAVEVQKSVALNYEPISFETTQYPPVTNIRPNSRETVRLENETAQSFLEKPISKPVASILESILSPTPLVDGVKEEEKYGNSGDKFIGIGRTLVNGFETFSNFLNAVVDFPRKTVKKTSQGITDVLNKVGARLVGLE
ncbi:uncharacterized protein LOC122538134 isoform X2 [Frieseomelitta varia]|uniref:uncharacterized protein LOC122538134 isoform X2 n=1 Tax=Frieseomelitta varia TaxID=561572 RepID=UPI001CB68F4B|nr:uncharacterized protein LOC122538134 isoform X2 [Frieseomelitta varia]